METATAVRLLLGTSERTSVLGQQKGFARASRGACGALPLACARWLVTFVPSSKRGRKARSYAQDLSRYARVDSAPVTWAEGGAGAQFGPWRPVRTRFDFDGAEHRGRRVFARAVQAGAVSHRLGLRARGPRLLPR